MARRQARRDTIPATILRTETVIRIRMRPRAPETVRRRTLDAWLPPLLPPADPDAQAGRGRDPG